MLDVVEKKLTNLAYISTKQNKADLMTKCHTSEAHKRGCAMIGLRTRLKQNKEVKMQREKKSISSNEEEMRIRRQVKKCRKVQATLERDLHLSRPLEPLLDSKY